MRRLGTLLLLATYASACVGPISDWPHKNSDGDDSDPGISTPITGGSPDAGLGGPGGVGGTGGTVGGGSQGSLGGGMTGSTGGTPAGTVGGLLGGTGDSAAGDSGAAPSGGSSDAGAVRDAGTTPNDDDAGAVNGGDAGAVDGGDAGAPDAGPGDAGASDAGCGPLGDAGMLGTCPAYRCQKTLSELSAASAPMGACNTPLALPLACSGQLGRAALQCAQDNAFSLSVSRAITSCMRRVPLLTQIPSDCLGCYADETLCTLSRCFVACIDGSDPACQQCRHDQCGAALSKCSGLPAP